MRKPRLSRLEKISLIICLVVFVGPFLAFRMIRIMFYDGPVDFYGQVVNEKGEPVPDAAITAAVEFSNPLDLVGKGDRGDRGTLRARSGADGRFRLHGTHAALLRIYSIEVPGAEWVPGFSPGYSFGVGFPDHYVAKKSEPVVFLVTRPDVPPPQEIPLKGLVIPWDGQPVRIPLAEDGAALSIVSETQPPPRTRSNDWSLSIFGEHCELIPVDAGNDAVAPVAGYQPQVSVSDTRLLGSTTLYAIRTDSGKYGRLRVTVESDHSDRRGPGIEMGLLFNPSGNRNIR